VEQSMLGLRGVRLAGEGTPEMQAAEVEAASG
jgi:hypothetical protein